MVSLPGKSHGQRSSAGCSPWGAAKVLDTTFKIRQQQSDGRTRTRHRETEMCERQRMREDGTLKKFKYLLRLEHRV